MQMRAGEGMQREEIQELFSVHFNDVHLWRAEEAHAEDCTHPAGDKDAAVAFEGEESGGHGGAEAE